MMRDNPAGRTKYIILIITLLPVIVVVIVGKFIATGRCQVDWSVPPMSEWDGRGLRDLSATFKGFHFLEKISHVSRPMNGTKNK